MEHVSIYSYRGSPLAPVFTLYNELLIFTSSSSSTPSTCMKPGGGGPRSGQAKGQEWALIDDEQSYNSNSTQALLLQAASPEEMVSETLLDWLALLYFSDLSFSFIIKVFFPPAENRLLSLRLGYTFQNPLSCHNLACFNERWAIPKNIMWWSQREIS